METLENAIYFEGSQLEKAPLDHGIYLSETVAHAVGSDLQCYCCKVGNTGLVICENTQTKQEIRH